MLLSLLFIFKERFVILFMEGINIWGSGERLVGIVERIDLVDTLYGITKEEREVLDVIRGIKDLKVEGESEEDGGDLEG